MLAYTFDSTTDSAVMPDMALGPLRCRTRAALQDASRLQRVLETLTPSVEELEILPGGLKDFISDGERRLLLETYRSLPGADHTAWACATALGL